MMWHAAVLHHYHLLRHEHPTNADTTAVRPPFDSRWHANANRPKSASSYSRKNGKPRCRLTDVTRLKIKFLSSYVCSSEARQTWLHEYVFKIVFCDFFELFSTRTSTTCLTPLDTYIFSFQVWNSWDSLGIVMNWKKVKCNKTAVL